ncbi:head-tail adaptor [Cyanophage NATL1A-7]|uniref:Head-tail connector protein n=1 Tax=Cyanophage NATL1A-7 TaxID=445693 RepID=E3SN85_9CAUD|nr:head-tail adaptor [Cyanophage NATL1A-7]ADP00089.1 head-tail connector protein [Cyanophage NATL1A-7]
MKARDRYAQLTRGRTQFLHTAVECSRLTLPYLVQEDLSSRPEHQKLHTPWQSVGAKSVVNLAAKLMLALLPPQTSFFKLQIQDNKIGVEFDPKIRSEMDLSFAKMERMVMDYISASNDRVVVHQALKHLIVSGNALIFMGKDGLKNYPLNRYVCNRDGNGNICEIVTKELISRKILGQDLPVPLPNSPGEDGYKTGSDDQDVEVYTYVRLDDNGRWVWHQEAFDNILPGSRSTAPKNTSPWLVLRFNTVDGEDYGRGRVEEFLGDIRSLEGLSQSLVEGSAAASKVVFLVSPSSTTKPKTIADAGNGAIVQGRPDDVGVIQVGKTADFRTAQEQMMQLEKRINEAFLVLNVRQSERTTAEEVRLTQMELEQQLGGLFSLLTVEFLEPYLNRTLHILQRNKEIPKIPKESVRPQIIAGVNALGRGQDEESLIRFAQTLSQTVGPEMMVKYLDPGEYVKRLAAAQGIDALNLIKSPETMAQEKQQQMQEMQQGELLKQAGQLAGTPMMDPSKNPAVGRFMNDGYDQLNANNQGEPPNTGEEEAPP